METVIATIQAAIKSEENSIKHYQQKIEADTKMYTGWIQNSEVKRDALQAELSELKAKFGIPDAETAE